MIVPFGVIVEFPTRSLLPFKYPGAPEFYLAYIEDLKVSEDFLVILINSLVLAGVYFP